MEWLQKIFQTCSIKVLIILISLAFDIPSNSQIDTCYTSETAIYHVINQSAGSSLFFAIENAEILSENPTNADSVVVKWGESDGLFTISVHEISINFCTGNTYKASVLVEKPETATEFIIPNVFTPNGDGFNDYFNIQAISSVSDFEITIYSRSGIKVFNSDNLNLSWNGQNNGSRCVPGVYYYVINYSTNNGFKTVCGFIHLFR